MAQVYTVTASTSVVLVNALQSPNTVVLLSSINYPGHIVGIQDTTGSAQIAVTPIIVSTMEGVSFYDGTSSILINRPNDIISLSSWTSNTWQILNNIGFLNTLSNAFLENLTTQNVYTSVTSSIYETVSTINVNTLNVTKSIILQGNALFTGDITIAGGVDFFSTLQVGQNLYMSSSWTVQGRSYIPSTAYLQGSLLVSETISTLNSVYVGDSLYVSSQVSAFGALLPKQLSAKTVIVDSINVGGNFLTGGSMSSLNSYIGGDLFVQGTANVKDDIIVDNTTFIQSTFNVQTDNIVSSLLVVNQAEIQGNINVRGQSYFENVVSSFADICVKNSTLSLEHTLVKDYIPITGQLRAPFINVGGDAEFSSITVRDMMYVSGDVYSYGSNINVYGNLNVGKNIEINGDFFANSNLQISIQDGISTVGDLNFSYDTRITSTLFANYAFTTNDLQYKSTLLLASNVSTQGLFVRGDLTILGDIYAEKSVAEASTLGAPIDLSISTLTLSNTLFIQARGDVPYLEFNNYPSQILVNSQSNNGEELYVNGELKLNTIFYPSTFFASTVRASTIINEFYISSVVIGANDYNQAAFNIPGTLAVGTSNPVVIYATNTSNWRTATSNIFPTDSNQKSIAFDGNFRWVIVSGGAIGASNAAYSDDGFNWNLSYIPFTTFSNPILKVTYGNGKFVALAFDTLYYSTDGGVSWTLGTSFVDFGGFNLAYSSNLNRWVAGGNTALGSNIVIYSDDGINWSNGSITIGGSFFTTTGIAYGNNKFFLAAFDNVAGSVLYSSSNGSNWTRYMSNFFPQQVNAFAYGNGLWVAAAFNSFDPLQTIFYSINDGSNWTKITSGGFVYETTDVIFNTILNTFIACSSYISNRPNSIQTSIDGINWIKQSTGTALVNSLAQGGFLNNANKFVINTPIIVSEVFSNYTVQVSTIEASSFNGAFLGDGAGLTNAVQFGLNVFTSSISTAITNSGHLFSKYMSASNMSIANTLYLSTTGITYDIVNYIATGVDKFPNSIIQTTKNNLFMAFSATGPSFNYYGNKVQGNSNLTNPLFVAVGADSRSSHSILYSSDQIIWNSTITGGFRPNANGICEGLDVVYSSNLGRWVVCGSNPGSTDTIFYSDDGSNWTPAVNAFSNVTNILYKGPTSYFIASGGNGAYPQIKYSITGDTWINVSSSPLLAAIAEGTTFAGPNTLLAAQKSSPTVAISIDQGVNWSTLVSVTTTNPLNALIYATTYEYVVGNDNVTNIYSNSFWLGASDSNVYRSVEGLTWNNIANLSNLQRVNTIAQAGTVGASLILGATSGQKGYTLLRSQDGSNWFSIFDKDSGTSGFTPTALSTAAGYAVITLPLFFGSDVISYLTGGESVQVPGTYLRPKMFNIFGLYSNINNGGTSSNAFQNSLSTVVRSIAYAGANEPLRYVMVGDGPVPEKTIGRSVDPTAGRPIFPAIYGGFSTTGYGVEYFSDDPGGIGLWVAVGDSDTVKNTIQYSAESANWFGTNNSGGLRQGGRGVGRGLAPNALFLATGKDTDPLKTIAYSSNGFNWSTIASGGFSVKGNRIKLISTATYSMMYAVGEDAVANRTIQYSGNGSNWSNVTNTFFKSCHDIDLFDDGLGNLQFMAVGEPINSIAESNYPRYTIQRSSNGLSWLPITSGGFTGAGYGIRVGKAGTPFSNDYQWLAVGRDINGDSNKTISYCKGGLSNTFNFLAEDPFNPLAPPIPAFVGTSKSGSANGIFAFPGVFNQFPPSIQFPNLNIQNSVSFFDNTTRLNPSQSVVRYFSTNILFNENLLVTTDKRVGINFNEQVITNTVIVNGQSIPQDDDTAILRGSNNLSVRGSVWANNLIFSGEPTPGSTLNTAVLVVSTFVNEQTFIKEYTTPSLFMGYQGPQNTEPKANKIVYSFDIINNGLTPTLAQVINMNDTLYASEFITDSNGKDTNLARYTNVGINISAPRFNLDVNGTAAFSSILAEKVNVTGFTRVSTTADNIFVKDNDNMLMYSGISPTVVNARNTIFTEPSSILFNSVLNVNLSTQKVGCYTQNPQYSLHDPSAAYMDGFITSTLRTDVLFLNLQSI